MKRPRNHIIEDESEEILKKILPPEWVLRKLSPDYGIDYLVEVFENNESTGTHFFIQLKGTDDIEENEKISYSLNEKYIEYYSKLALPILLVYVCIKSENAWAKWVNRTKINPPFKSKTIKFSPKDLLTTKRFHYLGKNLSLEIPPVIFKYENIKTDSLKSFLKTWIFAIVQKDMSKKDEDLSDEIVLEFDESNSKQVHVLVKDERFQANVQAIIPSNYERDLLLIPETDSIPHSLHDVLFALSEILLVRNSESAVKTLFQILPYKDDDKFVDTISMISKCISTKQYSEIIKLGKASIEKKNFNLFQLLYMALFEYSEDKQVKKIKEDLLLFALEKSPNDSFTATLNYNLANHYLNNERRREALSYYLKARRKEPDYQNRAYWNREVAGLLFLEKRFALSAKMYANCLKQGPYSHEPLTIALTANAHFMNRNFKESLKLFEEYHQVEENPDLEFTLKKQVIKTVRDEYGFQGDYSQLKALNHFEQVKKDGLHKSNEQLAKCLVFDPICAEVRFQEGLNLMEVENFEGACISFLIAALVSEYDVSAWLNSFFMALETQSHMMGIVLSVAYKKCGYGLIEVFRNAILSDERIPVSMKTGLIESMREQFEEFEKLKN